MNLRLGSFMRVAKIGSTEQKFQWGKELWWAHGVRNVTIFKDKVLEGETHGEVRSFFVVTGSGYLIKGRESIPFSSDTVIEIDSYTPYRIRALSIMVLIEVSTREGNE